MNGRDTNVSKREDPNGRDNSVAVVSTVTMQAVCFKGGLLYGSFTIDCALFVNVIL
jgi:hypothetical protein